MAVGRLALLAAAFVARSASAQDVVLQHEIISDTDLPATVFSFDADLDVDPDRKLPLGEFLAVLPGLQGQESITEANEMTPEPNATTPEPALPPPSRWWTGLTDLIIVGVGIGGLAACLAIAQRLLADERLRPMANAVSQGTARAARQLPRAVASFDRGSRPERPAAQVGGRGPMQQLVEMAQGLSISMGDSRAQREADKRAEEEERPVFDAVFVSKYDTEPPPFFDGAFAAALESARVEKRLLLVWLYGQSDNDEALGRLVGSEVFVAFVAEYYTLWPGDAERWLLPKQLREILRVQAPALVVLQPQSVYEVDPQPWGDPRSGLPTEFPAGSAWSVQAVWEGVPDAEAIMTFLAEHGDRAQAREQAREEERRGATDRAANARALREEQDREFEESLEKDRAAAVAGEAVREVAEVADHRAAAAAAADVVPEVVDHAAAADVQQQMAQQRVELARAALAAKRRATAEQMLAAGASEAPPVGDTRCELIIRFPNGRRATRVFAGQQRLSDVYVWAECYGEMCGLQGSERFDLPEAFVLATTYPRAMLRDRDKSLLELKLVPNAVLALYSEDE